MIAYIGIIMSSVCPYVRL